jgi:hypothetical protein
MPVFPCRPGGKEPLTPHGHLDASTDPRRIHAWWNAHPNANIGVPTGERSGILALDVDEPASLKALELEHGKLPVTCRHSTGSGGMHHLYRYPPSRNIRNSAGKLAPGIDVRGEGGYIIAPPSSTIGPYRILENLPLTETPVWLLEALERPPERRRGEPRATTAIHPSLDGRPIPSGTRDDTLTSIAGRLHDGRALEDLTRELLEINTHRCEPPLPNAQVEKIARSIHARTPCNATRRAASEVLEALEMIEAKLWQLEWRGMGWLSARDVYVTLIKTGRTHGELIPAGVRVSISIRELALGAAVSKRTAHYALKRLKATGLVRADNATRAGTKSGALVLLSNAIKDRANLHHSSTGGGKDSSGATLRAPRLRWSAPLIERVGGEVFRSTIRRLGKGCGAVIDALERSGGTATLEELAEALHKTRTRDLRRRAVARLEAEKVVECSGDIVVLTHDWIGALNRERGSSGEIAAHRRDMRRYNEQRVAYRDYLERMRRKEMPEQIPKRRPLRDISHLEELEIVSSDPELLKALSTYLDRNPRRREELPSWLSVALWAEGYTPIRVPPEEIVVALQLVPAA